MSNYRQDRTPADIPCEQCHNHPGTEPHDCTNQAQWHDSETIICNCCETCQELCRKGKAVPF